MKKEDLRVIKTKTSIKDSFIDLVKEKGYNKVSVTDIVKKANINRNTFYLHYEDKEDLIKTLISDATVKMDSFFDSVQFLKQTTFDNISGQRPKNICPFTTPAQVKLSLKHLAVLQKK